MTSINNESQDTPEKKKPKKVYLGPPLSYYDTKHVSMPLSPAERKQNRKI